MLKQRTNWKKKIYELENDYAVEICDVRFVDSSYGTYRVQGNNEKEHATFVLYAKTLKALYLKTKRNIEGRERHLVESMAQFDFKRSLLTLLKSDCTVTLPDNTKLVPDLPTSYIKLYYKDFTYAGLFLLNEKGIDELLEDVKRYGREEE